ncbi:MAG TPA: permease prefix domain 1-containing protein, partial [Nitrospira sp.]|nr:permease prefix domain 1-containing protein [Nitrospira sp.]
MNSFTLFAKKLSLLFRRDRFHSELDEEMAFHREQAEKDFLSSGMSAEQAHIAAARQFGNATHLREQSQSLVAFRLETIAQDLHFALRQLRQHPGFAV